MTTLTQRFRLRGVHFLYDPNHSEPKHGHEYFLQVCVSADCGAKRLRETVENEIVVPWDKKNWNTMNVRQASGELLVEEFDRLLRKSPIGDYLKAVELRETRKNRFISSHSQLVCCE